MFTIDRLRGVMVCVAWRGGKGGSGAMAAARCARSNRWSDEALCMHSSLCLFFCDFFKLDPSIKVIRQNPWFELPNTAFGENLDRKTKILIYCYDMYGIYDHVTEKRKKL